MQENQVECEVCGFKWAVNSAKRGRKDLLCISCRAKPAISIQYGQMRCLPWPADVDEQLRPVTADGFLVLPGKRVCGHSDCVQQSHVVAGDL